MQEKNRFQKNDEARARERRKGWDSVDANAREESRKQQREAWVSPDRAGSKSKDGFVLDAKTQAAKEAYEAELEARKSAAQAAPAPVPVATVQNPLTLEEEYLLARQWADSNPDWHGSDYNSETLKAIVEAFQLPHTAAGFQRAWEYGVRQNHFEESPVRKRSGYPTPRRAPVPFTLTPPAPQAPPTPQEQAPEPVRSGRSPVYIKQNISAEENRALREMPLDELKKIARAGYKPDLKGNYR